MNFHSGYCSVIGRPNVGKSTLLNALIGEKISIISDKAQTTRNSIQLIYTDERMQIIFLDTPGVQIPKNELGEAMLRVSRDALDGVDVCLFVTDPGDRIGPLDRKILEELHKLKGTPIILVLNKLDLLEGPEALDRLIGLYEEMELFEMIIPLSAKERQGTDRLLEAVYDLLPEGPQYFDEDAITDRPERFVVSELIREKCLRNLDDEIPHGIYVAVESMKQRPDTGLYDIHATIFVEKESHKGMVIGKGGQMLGRIGKQARLEVEKLLGSRVNLKLWVKVEKNWRKDKKKVKDLGYE